MNSCISYIIIESFTKMAFSISFFPVIILYSISCLVVRVRTRHPYFILKCREKAFNNSLLNIMLAMFFLSLSDKQISSVEDFKAGGNSLPVFCGDTWTIISLFLSDFLVNILVGFANWKIIRGL